MPELARGMGGSAIKEFQKAKDEFTDELHRPKPSGQDPPPAATVPQIENSRRGKLRPRGSAPNPDRTDRV